MADDETPGDDDCDLCEGCGEIEATNKRGDRVTVACPDCVSRELRSLEPFWSHAATVQVKANENLYAVIRDACDLLAERTHGSPARSPAHNARVLLESVLPHSPTKAGEP